MVMGIGPLAEQPLAAVVKVSGVIQPLKVQAIPIATALKGYIDSPVTRLMETTSTEGVGSFEMEGEIRSSNNRLLASAKIYQDMSIIAKGCDALPGDNNNQALFGLAALYRVKLKLTVTQWQS